MDLKCLIVGILLGASLLIMGIGLKNAVMGAVAMVLIVLAALIGPGAAFLLFPLVALAMLILAAPAGSSVPGPANLPAFRITAVSGPLKGMHYNLSEKSGPLSFGRENCNVALPPDTAGVSRQHCTVQIKGGQPYLTDTGSHYGTFILNPPQRLQPNTPTPLADNASFCLARQDILFTINRI